MGNQVSPENVPDDVIHYIMRQGLTKKPQWTAMDLVVAASINKKVRRCIFNYTGKINVTAPLYQIIKIDPFVAHNNFVRQAPFDRDAQYHPSLFTYGLVEFGNQFNKQDAVKFTVRVVVNASTPMGAMEYLPRTHPLKINERDLMVDFEIPEYDHFAYDIQAKRWEDLYWSPRSLQSERFVTYLNNNKPDCQISSVIHGCNNIPFTINGDLELLDIVTKGDHWTTGVSEIEDRLAQFLELPWIFGTPSLLPAPGSEFSRKSYMRHKTAILYDGMLFPTMKLSGLGKFCWELFWATANVRIVRFYILGVNIQEKDDSPCIGGCYEITSGKYKMGIDVFSRMKMHEMAEKLRGCLLKKDGAEALERIEFIAPNTKNEREEKFKYFQDLRYESEKHHSVAKEVLEPANTFHTLIEWERWEDKVFSKLEELSTPEHRIEVVRPVSLNSHIPGLSY
tara:strand:- start:5758 stop:7110 length:1353 start_codon:yes stop_codon:yes gene_type:complete